MSALLPFSFAQTHGVLKAGGELLHKPGINYQVIAELQRHYHGEALALVEIPEADFKQRLKDVYHDDSDAAQQAVADMDLSQLVDDIPEEGDLLAGNNDAPVIRLINAILAQAVKAKASDIHLEPCEDRVAVRFRVDGVLNEVLQAKAQLAPLINSRIKVMARLDIAEKRLPQDGRMSVTLAGHTIDIRVSTLPSAYGERAVLRILDQAAGALKLHQLQMPAKTHQAFANALRKPHGIILVTGPTGSGKTTSLYAGLTEINDRSRNIMTIEDPVEYLLPGIAQTQVNTKANMTFVRGLRAILRQDPDVVMIGEIRDGETASIAVQSSLTGHMVLSTLHTNTAIGAVTRLLDMGVEAFLLSSSLDLIMAQRLVRRLCGCKKPHKPTPAECEQLGFAPEVEIFSANGCEQCGHTGYRGRLGIYEHIVIDEQMRQLIHEGAGEQTMLAYARRFSPSILDAGKARIIEGDTSVEEVLRVTTLS
ncbi:Flp pilus assembly complex ATPase component TadA [Simiduia sp. 21SJ11W-1]|uniref:GspE/PulE family protein n=1 Tax=Simiduia sp. 21SJ11W-1 TaxID=2909669 RepID=UPI00209DA148|nr:ATPase, T2SS/T4P/T4SS family [Simiduia sp. 21SJ11W-1]UTA47885.1 Flp pilus assembly complex ATPase component TadA [Simiduia sp. 21SJ11W-1]